MSTYDDLKNYFEEISEHYSALVADGKIDFSDAVFLAGKAAASFVQVVERFTHDSDGNSKKAIVLEALDHFYDDVIKPLDIAAIPNIIEPVVDSAVKQIILTFASAGIDTIIAIFNKTGWNPAPPPAPQAYAAPYVPGQGLDQEMVYF